MYILGKLIGFVKGVIAALLGIYAIIGILFLSKEYDERKSEVHSCKDALNVAAEITEKL